MKRRNNLAGTTSLGRGVSIADGEGKNFFELFLSPIVLVNGNGKGEKIMALTVTMSAIFFGICCFSEDINLFRKSPAEEHAEESEISVG